MAIPMKNAIIGAAAAWILLSPAVTQIFGVETAIVRPWRMFGGVGVGIAKGEFLVESEDGAVRAATPLQVLGEQHYPRVIAYTYDKRIVDQRTLRLAVADFCDTDVPDGSTLSYHGNIGALWGWARLDATDLCAREGDDA